MMMWNLPTLLLPSSFFGGGGDLASGPSFSAVRKNPVNLYVRPCEARRIPSRLTVEHVAV